MDKLAALQQKTLYMEQRLKKTRHEYISIESPLQEYIGRYGITLKTGPAMCFPIVNTNWKRKIGGKCTSLPRSTSNRQAGDDEERAKVSELVAPPRRPPVFENTLGYATVALMSSTAAQWLSAHYMFN